MTGAGTVFVETAARLHFGVLDLRGALGRWFGGIGAASPEPTLLVSASRAESLAVGGAEADPAGGRLGGGGAAPGPGVQRRRRSGTAREAAAAAGSRGGTDRAPRADGPSPRARGRRSCGVRPRAHRDSDDDRPVVRAGAGRRVR